MKALTFFSLNSLLIKSQAIFVHLIEVMLVFYNPSTHILPSPLNSILFHTGEP
jgi:hypothetical protein